MDGNKTSLPNYLSGHGSQEDDSGVHGILKFLLEEKQHMGENPYLNLLIEGIRKGSLDPSLARESYEKYLEKEGVRRPPDSDARTRLPYGGVTQHSALIDTRRADGGGGARRGARQPFFSRNSGFDEETFGRMESEVGETETSSSADTADSPYGLNQVTAAGEQKSQSHSHLFDDFDIPEYASPPPQATDAARPQQGRHRFEPPSFAQPYDRDVPIDSESLLLDYDATRAGGGITAYIPPTTSGSLRATDAHDYYQRTRMPGDGFVVPDPLPSIPEHLDDYEGLPGAASLAEEPTDFEESDYQEFSEQSDNSATSFLSTDAEMSEGPKSPPVSPRFVGGTPSVVAEFEDEETVQHQFRTDPSILADEPSLPVIASERDYIAPFENPDHISPRRPSFHSFEEVEHVSEDFERLDESTECEENSLASVTDQVSDIEEEDDGFDCESTRLTSTSSENSIASLEPSKVQTATKLGEPKSSVKHGFIADFRTQADPIHFPEATSAEVSDPFTPLESSDSIASSRGSLTALTEIADEQITAEAPRNPNLLAESSEELADQLNINSFVIDQFFGEEGSPFADQATELEDDPPPAPTSLPRLEQTNPEVSSSRFGHSLSGSPSVPSAPPSVRAPKGYSSSSIPVIPEGLTEQSPHGDTSPPSTSITPSLTPPPMNRVMPPRVLPQGPPPRISTTPPPPQRVVPVPLGSQDFSGIPDLAASHASKTPPPPPHEHSGPGTEHIPPPRNRGSFERSELVEKKGRSIPPPPPPSTPGPPLSAPAVPLFAPSNNAVDSGGPSGGGPFRSEECIPQFIVPFTELSQRGVNIDHRMAYALSQIDGFCCIRDICDIVGIPVEEMVESLNELAKKNIVRRK